MLMKEWRNVREANKFYKDDNLQDNRIITKNLQVSLNNKLPNNNVAVIIPFTSNRSLTFINQNVRQLGSTYVVTDLNGQVQQMVAKNLIEGGYTVKVLNLMNLEKSDHYNPFEIVDREVDVYNLYNALATVVKRRYNITKVNQDPFREYGISLYSKVLCYTAWLHAKDNGKKASIKDLAILAYLETEVIGEDDKDRPITKLSVYMDELEKKECYNLCTRWYKFLKEGNVETVKEISEVFKEMFDSVSATEPESIFDGNDINLRELGIGVGGDKNKRMAVFVRVPNIDFLGTHNWIAELFYTQCMSVLARLSDEEVRGPLPVRVEFFLDDLSLGCVPANLERELALSKSRNISIVTLFPSIECLQELYPETWQLIMDNSSILVCMGMYQEAVKTHHYINSLLGTELTIVKDISRDDAIIFIGESQKIYDKGAYKNCVETLSLEDT